jgi:hypothetical protein
MTIHHTIYTADHIIVDQALVPCFPLIFYQVFIIRQPVWL